jgi:hypothetical protein
MRNPGWRGASNCGNAGRAYFGLDDLPPLSCEHTAQRHLAEVLAHVLEPGWVAAFG